MKNLFNDLSREEKQRILEMHGMKRNLISEQNSSIFMNYCTKCSQPEISCQKGKLVATTINQYAADLAEDINRPTNAGIKIGQLTGGKFQGVIDTLNSVKASGGNFHDFCAIAAEFQRMKSQTLCDAMGRIINRGEISEITGIIDSLAIVPCSSTTTKKTTTKKPIRKKTPIQKPGMKPGMGRFNPQI